MNVNNTKYPCRNCVYFNVYGYYTRTEPCEGRQTKTKLNTNKATAK